MQVFLQKKFVDTYKALKHNKIKVKIFLNKTKKRAKN